eukprot:3270973-Amphidinium_carterae.1
MKTKNLKQRGPRATKKSRARYATVQLPITTTHHLPSTSTYTTCSATAAANRHAVCCPSSEVYNTINCPYVLT